MVLQIFGHDKCSNTRKAKMYFSERKTTFQYINIKEKPPSAGEWSRIFKGLEPDDIIDQSSKLFQVGGYAWKVFDPKKELYDNPLLALTPIICSDYGTTAGYKPDIWKTWKVL